MRKKVLIGVLTMILLLTACGGEPSADSSALNSSSVDSIISTSSTFKEGTMSTTTLTEAVTTATTTVKSSTSTKATTSSLSAITTTAGVTSTRWEDSVRLLGRHFYDDRTEATYFSYTASGFELVFTGKKLEMEIVADAASIGSESSLPYLSVYVQDMETPKEVYAVKKARDTVVLFSSQKVQTVKIRVLKRSEAMYSSFGVTKLLTDEGGKCSPTEAYQRKLLFLGDSITCAYGSEGKSTDKISTKIENGCDSYVVRTARALNAEWQVVSRSGIGVYSGYTPTGQAERTSIFLPLYSATDKYGENRVLGYSSGYDPSTFSPDAVVINLGTNDGSYTSKAGEAGIELFKEAYKELLDVLRKQYPKASILCTLGPTDPENEVFNSIVGIVKERNSAGDSKMFTFLFDDLFVSKGIGAEGHPTVKTHELMGKELTKELRSILGWT